VKKLLKSVYIYGSYRKIKTELSLFLDHSVESWGYPPVKTPWSYLESFWPSASVWRTDGRTDGRIYYS